MNVMFNLKLGRVGDSFAGYNGIDDSIFPVYHHIDYIIVYALSGILIKIKDIILIIAIILFIGENIHDS